MDRSGARGREEERHPQQLLDPGQRLVPITGEEVEPDQLEDHVRPGLRIGAHRVQRDAALALRDRLGLPAEEGECDTQPRRIGIGHRPHRITPQVVDLGQ